MQVFCVETFLTQFSPGQNFFKPSVSGGLRIFRAFASLFIRYVKPIQGCFGDVSQKKNIDFGVYYDVLKKPKHDANHASNDVNRPPLTPPEAKMM